MASPSFISSTGSTADVGATTHSVALPANQEDDLILVLLNNSEIGATSSATYNVPDGWTELYDVDIPATTAARAYAAYIVAGAGGVSSPITFTASANSGYASIAAVYRGINTSDPIDVTSSVNVTTGTASTCPTVTTSVADTKILRFSWADDDDALSAIDTGTIRQTNPQNLPGNGINLGLADEDQAAAGNSGAAIWTIDASEENGGATIALSPPDIGLTFDTEPSEDKNTFYVLNGTEWTLFDQVESFSVKKFLNQLSEFEVKLFDVTTAQKSYFKEQADVLFFSGTTMILKGRIQTIQYGDELAIIARGFGQEARHMDRQLEVIGRLLKEDGDFLLTELGNKILFLKQNRVEYSKFSAKEIAVEVNSDIMTTASSGIFSSDYGNVSIRFENIDRLKAIADLSETINFDWWVSQTSSDNYEENFINIAPIRGATSSQKTYSPTTNASFTSQERDITSLSNFIRILGYGDGINQLETTTFEASTQSSTLNSNIESTDTSIEVLDASDFDATGTARIAEEQLVYAGISSNTLTGCTRGTNSTTARSHLRNCYTEQFFDRDSPQAGSSIEVYGLTEDVLIDKTLQDVGAAELIASKRLLDRKDPIERIMVKPDEPFEDVASLDVGDKITVTSSESNIDGDFRIVGINYIDVDGALDLELEISNRSLEFVQQVRKQREEEQNLGKYMQGATNLYIMNVAENCDASNPLNVRFYMPSRAAVLNKVFLSFKLKDYRFSDAGGITEEELSDPSVTLQVGVDDSEETFGTFTTDQEEVNLTDFVTADKGWFNVKFTPNKRMRIESNLSVQIFLESK